MTCILTPHTHAHNPRAQDQSRTNTEARIKNGIPAFPATLSEGARSFIIEGESAIRIT